MTVVYNPSIVTDNLVFLLDAQNPISYSPNVQPYPTDIYRYVQNATKSNCTVSRDYIESPVGKTPLVMKVTGNDPHIQSYSGTVWNLAPARQNDTWTVSVWAKADSSTQVQLFLFGMDANGGLLSAPAGTYNVGTEWQRFAFTTQLTNANTAYVQARLDGPDNNGIGRTIWFDGMQVEKGSSATAFNSRTNSGYVTDTISGVRGTVNGSLGYSKTSNTSRLLFNGVDNFITIPSENFNFAAEQTIFMCIKPDEADSNRRNPYNQAYGGYGTITHEIAGDLNYLHGTNGGNTTPYQGRISNFTVGQNETAIIAVTRGYSFIRWYKNGELGNEQSNLYPVAATDGSPIIIGNGYTNDFSGDINYVALYDRELSASEIRQNFNAIRARYGL